VYFFFVIISLLSFVLPFLTISIGFWRVSVVLHEDLLANL
jgi:hypothetical protein